MLNEYKMKSVWLFGLLLVSTCIRAAEKSQDDWVYSMQPGDTIWNIAERYLLSRDYWRDLARFNQIEHPERLPVGSELRIPLYWLKVESATVQVLSVRGQVEYWDAQGNRQKLNQGDTLRKGDRLKLGDDATVMLEFSDGTRQVLSSDTEIELVRVNKFSSTGIGDTTVKVLSGGTENIVPTRGTRFQITTPSANTAVRGTEFRVRVPQEQAALSRMEVLKGAVNVSGDKGGYSKLPSGYGTTVEQGKAPAKPVKLLPAPRILSAAESLNYLPLNIQWQSLPRATKYRLQIADASGKVAPVIDEILTDTQFAVSSLANGNYRLSVRAIDAMGLEGFDDSVAFVLNALEISVDLEGDRLRLSWPETGHVRRYQLQVAADSSFSDVLFDTRIQEAFWEAKAPVSPVYFRVRRIDGAGHAGAWSKPVRVGSR